MPLRRLALPVAFVVAGCSRKVDPRPDPAAVASSARSTTAPSASAPVASGASVGPRDGKFVWRGTVGGQAVVARWDETAGAIKGTYFYPPSVESLTLEGAHDPSGKVQLTESVGEKPSGSFDGQMDAQGNVAGQWSDAKKAKSLPFTLAAARPDASGVATLVTRHAESTRKARNAAPEGFEVSTCEINVAWPEIVGAMDPAVEEKLNASLAAETGDPACIDGFSSFQSFVVQTNQAGVLSITREITTSTAGAMHPLVAHGYLNVALPSGTPIARTDVLTAAGIERLDRALATSFGAAGDPSTTDIATDAIKNDHVDFFISPAGLTESVANSMPYALQGTDLHQVTLSRSTLLPLTRTPSPIDKLWKKTP